MTHATSPRFFRSEADVGALVAAFEHCSLSPGEWNHRAYLAVAMWYLSEHPTGEASDRFIAALHLFNRARRVGMQAGGGYNETLTRFWLHVGRSLIAANSRASTLGLVNRLVALPRSLPRRFYSERRLWSRLARTHWVEPDRRALHTLPKLLGSEADTPCYRDRESAPSSSPSLW